MVFTFCTPLHLSINICLENNEGLRGIRRERCIPP
ncbi:unnamed protein product, partial [Rotaria sp. Silwood2]